MELNTERTKYCSIQMRATKIQKLFQTTEQQLNQLEQERLEHLELIHKHTFESKQIYEFEQKLQNQFDQQHLTIDKLLINERKLAFDLKQTNKELLDNMNSYRDMLERHEKKRIELEMNRKNLFKMIAMQQTQIDKEKEMKRMFAQSKTQLNAQFKRAKQAEIGQQQREWKMKVRGKNSFEYDRVFPFRIIVSSLRSNETNTFNRQQCTNLKMSIDLFNRRVPSKK
jgi:hypothetical protein